jgi:L-serine/L-threonine ammonia-lyase
MHALRHTAFAVATAVARALTTTPLHDVTPLIRSAPLSNKLNCDVFFKMDCAQPPGSFKLRGIGATVKEAVEQGADGVVSSSGGNAGLATAHAALALGIKCTVVLPTTTPDAVRRKLEDEYGAEVIVEGSVWDEANRKAEQLASEYKRPLVHPFEGETTWKGHSTLVQEVDAQLAELGLRMDAIVCCVGGGGLLAGVLRGVGDRDDCAIVAAETHGADSFAQSMEAGKPATIPITSIAKSLGAGTPSPIVLRDALASKRVYTHVVSDGDAVGACLDFADERRVLVEPACGAALACVYGDDVPAVLQNRRCVVVEVCGGAVINMEQMDAWARELLSKC